jgi:hypothetical protein
VYSYLGSLAERCIGRKGGRGCGEDEREEAGGGVHGGADVLGGHDREVSAAFGGENLEGRRARGRTPCHCWPLASSKEVGKEHGSI